MNKKYILDKLSQIDKNKYGIIEIGLFGTLRIMQMMTVI